MAHAEMKVLLDTHIWIWSQLAPERLVPAVRAALEAPHSELWLPPISVWEFLLLVERGRLILEIDVEEWLDRAWSSAAWREAPLNREVARRSRTVVLPHQDPADRFIAATAQVYDLTLVTDDDHLLKGRGFAKLANRAA
jgi:PIN domain nuclease of toxin-antitoxin system